MQIHAGEHRTVLDRAPPADGVGLAEAAIFRRWQLADEIAHDAMLVDETLPDLGMGLLDRLGGSRCLGAGNKSADEERQGEEGTSEHAPSQARPQAIAIAKRGSAAQQADQQADHAEGQQLRADERQDVRGPDADEGIGQRPRRRHGGVREESRGGRPIPREDGQRDIDGDPRVATGGSQTDEPEQEHRREEFAEELRPAGAGLRRDLQHRLPEHQVDGPDAGDGPAELREEIADETTRRQRAVVCRHEADDGIEVRAGDGPQRRKDDVERGPGREAVPQQGDGGVAGGERLAHDARAGDGEQQQGGAEELGADGASGVHRTEASFRPAA